MNADPPIPARLWKYRDWDAGGRTRRLIVNGELYFPTVYQLNDPFEFRWCDKFPTDEAGRDLYVREFCSKFSPRDSLRQRRLNYAAVWTWIESAARPQNNGLVPSQVVIRHGVFCASAKNDNLLMWSHYGSRHRGVCISIRTEHLSDRRILPVEYSDRLPVVDAWDYIKSDREAFVKASVRKSPDWEYEQEWRTVGHPGKALFPGIVDRVVIGAMAEKETRSEVFAAVASAPQSIEVVEARLYPREYKLRIPKFN